MRLDLGNERAIRAFFDMYARPLGAAELSYYLQVFGGDGRMAGKSVHRALPAFLVQYQLAARKWRRAVRVAQWFAAFPWIRGVAIVNTLSHVSVREESDIDVLVLCERGRVWLSRLAVNVILKLSRLRPGEALRDPVCPTFFVDEDHYNLSAVAISGGDVYLHFWLANVAPVWHVDQAFTSFFAENEWALTRREALPCGRVTRTARCWRALLRVCNISSMERLARVLQRRLFTDAVRTHMALPDRAVVVHDGMIKLHVNDRRAQMRDAWHRAYVRNAEA